MKKLALTAIMMILGSWTNAQQLPVSKETQVDYGDYSEQYIKCTQRTFSADNCDTEEYYRLKKAVDELVNKITSISTISQYNNTDFALKKSIEKRRQYAEEVCQLKGNLEESNTSINRCKMDKENTLFVDLYKLYEAVQNKR